MTCRPVRIPVLPPNTTTMSWKEHNNNNQLCLQTVKPHASRWSNSYSLVEYVGGTRQHCPLPPTPTPASALLIMHRLIDSDEHGSHFSLRVTPPPPGLIPPIQCTPRWNIRFNRWFSLQTFTLRAIDCGVVQIIHHITCGRDCFAHDGTNVNISHHPLRISNPNSSSASFCKLFEGIIIHCFANIWLLTFGAHVCCYFLGRS